VNEALTTREEERTQKIQLIRDFIVERRSDIADQLVPLARTGFSGSALLQVSQLPGLREFCDRNGITLNQACIDILREEIFDYLQNVEGFRVGETQNGRVVYFT
jgi:hypothetical protein